MHAPAAGLPTVVIETERLILRRFSLDDAPFILGLVNQPAFLRFIGDKGVRTLEDARAYITNGPLESYRRHGFGLYMVTLRGGGTPIGMCGILRRDTLPEPDIGFAFSPEFWGRGYAMEAASAVLAYGRNVLGLTSIVAVAAPDNYPSLKILRRLGVPVFLAPTEAPVMSEFANPASGAVEAASAYTAGILRALGDRDPLSVLRQTPQALEEATAQVPAALLAKPEKPGKWSMLEVIQHLADSELIGAYRFRMILAHDRPEIQAYDQDLWASRLRYAEANLTDTLQQFSLLRRLNVALFERLSPAERTRVGVHTERGPESLDLMMRLYAGHDLVHLKQLARVREAVLA